MKKKNILISIMLILALLTSCGNSVSQNVASGDMKESVSTNKSVMFNGINGGFDGAIDDYETSYTETANINQIVPMEPEEVTQNYDEKKIVYSASINMEAKDIEVALKTIKENIDELHGYIQSENRNNWNSFEKDMYMRRSSQLSIRIPSKGFETFLEGLNNEEMIITNMNKSSMDYSESYYDKETRIKSLNIQEERLLQLLSTATDVDVMLQIENRLSEIRYEIESLTKEMRTIDSKVEYSTVDIYMTEVMRYSSPITEPQSFLDELTQAFKDSAENFIYFLRDLSISLAYNSLSILFVVLIIIAVAVTFRKKKKKAVKSKPVIKSENKPEEK